MSDPLPHRTGRHFASAWAVRATSRVVGLAALGALTACAERPLVHGLLDPGGVIYRESEQEEWGARTTLKVRGMEF